MQTHVRSFQTPQLEGLYVGDLLYDVPVHLYLCTHMPTQMQSSGSRGAERFALRVKRGRELPLSMVVGVLLVYALIYMDYKTVTSIHL